MKEVASMVAIAIGLNVMPSTVNGQTPSCGEFTLYSEWVEAKPIDHAELGIGAGDRRVGVLRFLDESGAEVGRGPFVTSLIGDAVDGAYMATVHVYSVFSNGMIIFSGVSQIPDPDTEGRPDLGPVTLAIIGGTGEFANARGQVTALNDERGQRVEQFDVSCAQ